LSHRRPVPLWYALLAVVVSVLAIMVANVGYTVHVQREAAAAQREADREADRRWCGLITTLDEGYSVSPPQTEIGRKLARDIRALRVEFGCR
jgi:hypothetical protein